MRPTHLRLRLSDVPPVQISAMIRVRPATAEDAASWLAMRLGLWPEGSAEEHAGEINHYFAGKTGGRPAEVLLAVDQDGKAVGFAELAIRPYVEGCVTERVAYLEGWYTDPNVRRQGGGTALVRAAESWGHDQRCSEFASDADPDNDVSLQAHRALGFTDAGLVRCFCKRIAD